MSKGNTASAYTEKLRLTMLQINLYQYWTVTGTQLKRRSAPRSCFDNGHITITFLISNQYLNNEHYF